MTTSHDRPGSHCLNPACSRQFEERIHRCPGCGRRAISNDELAARGRHVALLGLILAAAMLLVLHMLGDGILSAINGRGNFRGTPTEAWLLLTGFGSLLAMAAALTMSGVLMIAGRRSRFSTSAAILCFGIGIAAIAATLVSAYSD